MNLRSTGSSVFVEKMEFHVGSHICSLFTFERFIVFLVDAVEANRYVFSIISVDFDKNELWRKEYACLQSPCSIGLKPRKIINNLNIIPDFKARLIKIFDGEKYLYSLNPFSGKKMVARGGRNAETSPYFDFGEISFSKSILWINENEVHLDGPISGLIKTDSMVFVLNSVNPKKPDNRNVNAFDLNGKKLWKINKPPYRFSYHAIGFNSDSGKLLLLGYSAVVTVDPSTGKVLGEEFTK